MSRWKKILIAAALAVVVLIVTVYAFFTLYDFNKFKPINITNKLMGVLMQNANPPHTCVYFNMNPE